MRGYHLVIVARVVTRESRAAVPRRRMATVVALCDCPADITGRVFSSLDLIDEWGLNVRGLDGVARV